MSASAGSGVGTVASGGGVGAGWPPWAVVMQLDLPAGAGAGGAADVGGSDADGHQLAVSAVRPLVLWEPLPSVRVMALMPSAAALTPRPVGLLAAWIVAPMAPASPAAGLCPQVRSCLLGATRAAHSAADARRGASMPAQRLR
jgi:hypothetical protein